MSGTRSKDGQYDLVIGGGGMIGASLAIALAPLGLRIAVVESVSRVEADQPSFDDRSTALSGICSNGSTGTMALSSPRLRLHTTLRATKYW